VNSWCAVKSSHFMIQKFTVEPALLDRVIVGALHTCINMK
jgi:hypothetical protein